MKSFKWFSLLFSGIFIGMLQSVYVISENITLSQIIHSVGFGSISISIGSLGDFLIAWFPILIFQVLMGNYIYINFCVSSVYFFGRCNYRVRWYLREVCVLIVFSLGYVLFVFLGACVLPFAFCHIILDESAGVLFVYYVLIYSLWNLISTLIINVIGIIWDNKKSFMMIATVEMLMTVVLVLLDEWFSFQNYTGDNMGVEISLLKFVPVSHLVLKWHSNNVIATPAIEGMWGFNYEFVSSIWVLFVVFCTVFILGAMIVKKIDFVDNGRMM